MQRVGERHPWGALDPGPHAQAAPPVRGARRPRRRRAAPTAPRRRRRADGAPRAQADNPGLWNLHCHTDWHLYMGQKIYFWEAAERIAPPPAGFPVCPAACTYNFAAWAPATVQQLFGASGYPARR